MTPLSLPPPPKRPGRPPKPAPTPGPSAREAEARRLAALDELVSDDDLVVADRVDDPRLIDQAVRELAVEIAHLGFLARRSRARRTAAASKLAGQRIRALSRVAGLVLLRARSGLHASEEPPAELLERLRELFLNEVRGVGQDTLGEVLTSELMRRVQARLGTAGGGAVEQGEVEVECRIPVDSGLGPA